MQYDAMNGWNKKPSPFLSNDELFWLHERDCRICNQHPQSVASFHYEAMCAIGRAYAEALGMFRSYGPPDIAGPVYVQEVVT